MGEIVRINARPAALAAAVVVLALPAFAADTAVPARGSTLYAPAPMVTGHVEMGLGLVGGSSGGSTAGLFTGAGRANKVLWHGWNMELEAGGAGLFGSPSVATGIFSGYGHFWTMATPTHAFGAFAGAAFASGGTTTTLGVEGKAQQAVLRLGMASGVGQGFLCDAVGSHLHRCWQGRQG